MIEPMKIHHISMMIPKRVRVRPDAPDRYAVDPRWDSAPSIEKQITSTALMTLSGLEKYVLHSERIGTDIFYHISIPQMIMTDSEGAQCNINTLFLPADYCEIIHPGFLEAS